MAARFGRSLIALVVSSAVGCSSGSDPGAVLTDVASVVVIPNPAVVIAEPVNDNGTLYGIN